tara:strand:+ start:377 stop:502 length:126 start_codon:yes stop_codon:yes gene_type:complete
MMVGASNPLFENPVDNIVDNQNSTYKTDGSIKKSQFMLAFC